MLELLDLEETELEVAGVEKMAMLENGISPANFDLELKPLSRQRLVTGSCAISALSYKNKIIGPTAFMAGWDEIHSVDLKSTEAYVLVKHNENGNHVVLIVVRGTEVDKIGDLWADASMIYPSGWKGIYPEHVKVGRGAKVGARRLWNALRDNRFFLPSDRRGKTVIRLTGHSLGAMITQALYLAMMNNPNKVSLGKWVSFGAVPIEPAAHMNRGAAIQTGLIRNMALGAFPVMRIYDGVISWATRLLPRSFGRKHTRRPYLLMKVAEDLGIVIPSAGSQGIWDYHYDLKENRTLPRPWDLMKTIRAHSSWKTFEAAYLALDKQRKRETNINLSERWAL